VSWETTEARRARQKSEHYRRVAAERIRDRYALQPEYREMRKARALAYYHRRRAEQVEA